MSELKEIALNELNVKSNYRKTFNDKSLKELAESIKENGLVEPIIVRPNGNGYEIVAGERRVRACHIAKLVTIPAIIKNISDKDFLKIQLLENVQRENVPFMEEAFGIRDLRDKCDLDNSEIAKMLGKSEIYVFYMLKLTEMAREAQEAARHGELSKSVAVHIAKLKTADNQIQATRDLRRKDKNKLISEWTARKYIQAHFSESGVCKPRRSPIEKSEGNDFKANWKKHLVNFTCPQFEHWKAIVRGRTDTETLAEAVDVVMCIKKEKEIVKELG